MDQKLNSPIPEEDNNTIQRCPHDRENPYSMVNRDLIRDHTVSPECRWLIIYLLSMKDGWKINVKQILAHVKPFIGKNKLYKILNEAIEAGYMMREDWQKVLRRENGSYQGTFKRVRYFISETPKFKKCLPHPTSREAEDQDPDNEDNKERPSQDLPYKEDRLSVTGAVAPAKKPLFQAAEAKTSAPDQCVPSLIDPPPPDPSPHSDNLPAPVASAPVAEITSQEQDVPYSITITTTGFKKLTITQSELFLRIAAAKENWPTQFVFDAWKILSEYKSIVHDWWRFIEGTVQNLIKKQKSANITNSKKTKNGQDKEKPAGIIHPTSPPSRTVTLGEIFGTTRLVPVDKDDQIKSVYIGPPFNKKDKKNE